MVLTDRDIIKLTNKKDIAIFPFHTENVTGVGYDLRIGIIKPLTKINQFYEDERTIKIPPNCYCVVITEEFVWLSKFLIGTLHSKGTLSAKGLFTNSTNVDPNFKGQMIMSLYNNSDIEIVIEKNNPTFITLIFHLVKTQTTKLVGEEGTKNSTRVLHQMLNEIYTDKQLYEKQREKITDLLSYMNQKNHEIEPIFENIIIKAKSILNPFKRGKIIFYWSRIKKIFSFSFWNIIRLIGIALLISFMYDIIKTWHSNGSLQTEDKRMLILLFVTLITLLNVVIKNEKK